MAYNYSNKYNTVIIVKIDSKIIKLMYLPTGMAK